MRTLFLDLASHNGLIACVGDDKVSASQGADHRISDADLTPLIEGLLEKANCTYKDLTHVACVTGPGGFTSLRVGVAAANALAWALNIPVAGVHLSDLYEARAKRLAVSGERLALAASRHSLAAIVWLHSTKKSALFIREFDNEFSLYSQPTLITLDDLNTTNYQRRTPHWCGELIPEHHAVVEELGMEEVALPPIIDILPTFFSSLQYGHKQIEPWYGRGW